ncbi:MAG: flagellar basal body-associated FliL family protein [Gemmobacter sp.]
MRKLIPLIVAFLGLGLGAGAGIVLRPASSEAVDGDATMTAPPSPAVLDYVKLPNQFVVPVVEGGRVVAMVILSLSLEVRPGSSEIVYAREPKLRDALLQVMFDHANSGGFRGSFTDGSNLVVLRQALRETAVRVMGNVVNDVLISDIVRQDS